MPISSSSRPRLRSRTRPQDLVRASLLFMAMLPLLAALPARSQTVALSAAAYEVQEGSSTVDVTLEVSGPVEYGGVVVEIVDDTASAGADYETDATHFVNWMDGDASPRNLSIAIVDDENPEPTESFTVRLTFGKGLTIGDPSEATVTIFDDDAGGGDPVPFIEVGESIQNAQGEHVFFVEGGHLVDVTVRLDRMPDTPFEVDFTSDFLPYAGTLTFDGTQEQMVTVDVPVPPGGEAVQTGAFAIAPAGGTPARDASRGGALPGLIRIASGWVLSKEDCVLCHLYLWLAHGNYAGCPLICQIADFCPETTPGPAAEEGRGGGSPSPFDTIPSRIETLRRYRDEILALTTGGQYFVDRYAELSVDAATTLLRHPTFVFQFVNALEEWIPGLEALLAGNGGSAVVSPTMESDLNAVLDRFESLGDASFAQAVQFERTRLGLDAMAGQTMDEFQQTVETAGTTSIQSTSWGKLKGRYR